MDFIEHVELYACIASIILGGMVYIFAKEIFIAPDILYTFMAGIFLVLSIIDLFGAFSLQKGFMKGSAISRGIIYTLLAGIIGFLSLNLEIELSTAYREFIFGPFGEYVAYFLVASGIIWIMLHPFEKKGYGY